MAIEVIGKDSRVAKEITCRKCGSILRYYEMDVKKEISRDITGSSDIETYIECPCCSGRVIIKSW